jgi:hypothetical protein
MPKRLTKAQLDQFDALGYVSPVQLHDPAECAAIRERLEAFEAERPHDAAWAFDIKTNLLFDWVYRLSAHEPTLDAAEDLLGPNIFNTDTVFRIKEPGSETHYGWHQDAAWIQAKPCFIIAYVAITESTPENGGLRVVPGTHNSCLPFEVVVNEDLLQRPARARLGPQPERAAADRHTDRLHRRPREAIGRPGVGAAAARRGYLGPYCPGTGSGRHLHTSQRCGPAQDIAGFSGKPAHGPAGTGAGGRLSG